MVGGRLRRLAQAGPARAAAAVAAAAILVIASWGTWAALRPEPSPGGLLAPTDAELESLGLRAGALGQAGVLDSDLDGLPDAAELLVHGTDPTNASSSGLAIPDGWLVRHGIDPLQPHIGQRTAAVPPAEALPAAYHGRWPARYTASLLDIYSHGRPAAWDETTQGPFDSGLDPARWDANADGIPDGWAIAYGLDPKADVAGARLAGPDGLSVREAFEHDTDPTAKDTDRDGLADVIELAGAPRPDGGRWPPSDPRKWDSSGGGVCDGYLATHGLDPSQPASALGDTDADGAATVAEFNWSHAARGAAACESGAGLDPRDFQSGSSSIPDGWLILHGFDPLADGVDAKVTQRATTDPRPSGAPAPASDLALTVLDEYLQGRPDDWPEDTAWFGGTDPSQEDTDGDGLGDAYELAGWELEVWTQPGAAQPSALKAGSDPLQADADGDGATDGQEALAGTDPRRQDTDFDGIGDGAEAALGLGLDPRRADSAGDLLRDGERLALLETRANGYGADPSYEYEGQAPRVLRDWAAALPGAPAGATDAQLVALLRPDGNLDGDALLNILDPDMDGDGIPNGAEVRPALYGQTRFGHGPLLARQATDPANPDTDGDGLREDWELDHQRATGSGVSLDPAQWDSDGDQVPDGAEDPDGDGITWPSYLPALHENAYAFPNLLEQQFGTDPNVKDTDDDLLPDGWKAFWAVAYEGLDPATRGLVFPNDGGTFRVPSSPRPMLGVSQPDDQPASLVRTVTYERFSMLAPEAGGPEQSAGAPVQVQTASGTLSLHPLRGTLAIHFHDVVAAGTNPYLVDTDGDTIPDWWETLMSSVPRGLDPIRGQCVGVGALDPLVPEPAGVDVDGDGLDAVAEWQARSHPLCADTDMAGIPDGEESGHGLKASDPTDDASFGAGGADTDGDGLTDFEEITVTFTRFDNPDTDGDGLLDGDSRTVPEPYASLFLDLGIAWTGSGPAASREFLGEADPLIRTDPREVDDYRVGVPAGWVKMRLASSSDAEAAHARYVLGRPAWWQESLHGPWWGGGDVRNCPTPMNAPPGYQCTLETMEEFGDLRGRRDLDGDGLDDVDGDGEPTDDLWPAANAGNAPRPVADPPAKLEALAVRLAAQGTLDPAPGSFVRNSVPHPRYAEAADPRPATCASGLQLQGVTGTDISKGQTFTVTGRLGLASSCAASAVGGVAVQVTLAGQAFGAAFTAADGKFAVPVTLDSGERTVQIPAGATTALRGKATGAVQWTPDAGQVVPGPQLLTVRAAGGPATKATSSSLAMQVLASPRLLLDVPETVATGHPVEGSLTLTDGAGAPLLHPVRLDWDGRSVTVQPRPSDGGADFVLPSVPAQRAGIHVLTAASLPPPGPIPSATATKAIAAQRPALIDVEPVARADAGGQAIVAGQVRSIVGPSVQEGVPGVPVVARILTNGVAIAEREGVANGQGRFSLALTLPETLERGTYDVDVRAPGSAGVAAAQVSLTLRVRALVSFAQVVTAPIELGQPLTVAGMLLEPNGGPATGLVVEGHLAGLPFRSTTDAQGRFTAAIAGSVGPGLALQELHALGDEGHAGASNATERFVVTPTYLAVQDGEVARGAAARITLRLADGAGQPVQGAALNVSWAAEAVRTAVTGADGTAEVVRPGRAADALGSVNVTASYRGRPEAGLASSQAAAAWSIRALAGFELPPGNVTAGDMLPSARLVDAGTGLPLPGREVSVHATSGTTLRTTDSLGRFQLLPRVPVDTLPATLPFTIQFAGDLLYPALLATHAVDVRTPTDLRCTAPSVAVVGANITVACAVRDGGGRAVPGGRLAVALSGTPIGIGDFVSGEAAVQATVPMSQPAGPADLTLSFSGSRTHAASQVQVPILVAVPVVITLDLEPARLGQAARLLLHATAGGQPWAGQDLAVSMAGSPDSFLVRTDANGEASLSVVQHQERLAFVVRSPGGDGVAPGAAFGVLAAKSSPVTKASIWVPATAAVVGVLALAAGIFLAVRLGRRDPLDDVLTAARRVIVARGDVERQILEAYRILDEGAVALELLDRPAATARTLQSVLLPRVRPAATASLDRLIALFEDARYGDQPLPESARTEARAALDSVRRGLLAQTGGTA